MLYMFIVLAFIIGFFIGALCYSLGFLKIFPNHKVMDELTRTKRELASAKRVLDEFFKTSGQLFGDLDKSYREYAKFMNEAASKLSTQDGSLFIPQDELEVEESLKKMPYLQKFSFFAAWLDEFSCSAGACGRQPY